MISSSVTIGLNKKSATLHCSRTWKYLKGVTALIFNG
ncbi:GSCOCG00010178001-RA-CDS [Cotesia congregata]|nr:GSCOCG00010178001-RA-CDS [Cotesia congregata]